MHSFFKHILTKSQTRWWWIDSICINQKDLAERAYQVTLMKRIFHQAAETCVWLGDESEDSELAFTFLKWLAEQTVESRRGHIIEPWVLEIRDLDGPHQKQWITVNNLLNRLWWTRVWTVQEYAVAKYVQITCGQHSISRASFSLALNRIYDCDVDLNTPAPWNRKRLVAKFETLWHNKNKTCEELSLVATLAYLGDHQATDPRDYV